MNLSNEDAIKRIELFLKCRDCKEYSCLNSDTEKVCPDYEFKTTVDISEPLYLALDILKQQKTGHWIRQKTIYGLAETCECSECGRTIYTSNDEDLEDFPYCHCGAKMKGE